MRGGNRQTALGAIQIIVAQGLQTVDIIEDALRDGDHLSPRLGQANHPVALTLKHRKADLRFNLLDLLADARLRGVQRLGRRGNVIAAAVHFKNTAKSGQFHRGGSLYACSLNQRVGKSIFRVTGLT